VKTGVSILLVIKSDVFREGLVRQLKSKAKMKIISALNKGSDAIKIAQKYVPNVIIIDIDFPECGGIGLIEQFNRVVPESAIIALSHAESLTQLLSAIKLGAKGYISKAIDFENMVNVINNVAGGSFSVSGDMTGKILNLLKYESRETAETKSAFLTKQEKTIMNLAITGANNKNIADKLYISENTVKVHMHNIMQKIHAHNRQEAIIICIKNALLSTEAL
jgi:DNA-binding NarL/FixJ family response regulator